MNLSYIQKGFTFVETLIVIALVGIVSVVFVDFFINYNKTFNSFTANYDTSTSAGRVVNEVAEAVRQASTVASSRIVSGTTYTTGSTTLVVAMPSVDGTGSVVPGNSDYVIFYTNGTNVHKKVDPSGLSSRTASTVSLSDTLQSITFSYDNGDPTLATQVTTHIQTQKIVKDRIVSGVLTQKTVLRNK